MRDRWAWTSSALFALSLVAPGRAAAATKSECIAASERAQEFVLDRKLLRAREAFVSCEQEACPSAVRGDCVTQLARLDESIPTVVVSARRADGSAVAHARFRADGAATAVEIDGGAIPVDPGRHVFLVESDGLPPVSVEAVVTEGVRLQRVEAVFPRPAPAPSEPRFEAPAPPESRRPTLPTGTIVASAVGLVAFGACAYFGTRALVQSSDLHSHPGTFSQSDIDSLNAKVLAANVSMGVGVASAAVALVLWLTAPNGRR
jgi:hypothetical protein